jgi:TolA-binding protein
MKRKSLYGLLLLPFLIFGHDGQGQQTKAFDPPTADYNSAMTLFQQEQYGAAARAFGKVIDSKDSKHLEKLNASYYEALCGLELEHEDGAYKMTRFISDNPEHTLVKRAYFQLARYQFGNKKYSQALRSFENVEIPELDRDERIEYYYKKGISLYKNNKSPQAKSSLAKVVNTTSEYSDQAAYYYGVIAFEEGEDDLAAEYFEKVKAVRSLKKSVTHYLTMIYHRKVDYDRMLELAGPAYETASGKEKPVLALMIGDAYYQREQYSAALPYFEFYERFSRRSMKRADAYQVAYTYLQNENYKAAIPNFQQAVGEEDELSQNAYYHLGYCYLKTDQKKFASKAFASAYQLGFDSRISEDALFNYAKLTMEIASDPYNTAISALEDYIEKYPDSERVDEAYSFLANLYLSTNNYKQALNSFEKIKYRNDELREAYQKICFYRGIELFNENKLDEAIDLLKKASLDDYDRSIAAEALLWTGEAFYRQDNTWGAIKYYKEFLNKPASKKLDAFATAYYNLGYAYFNNKDYSTAVTWFGKFVDYRGNKDESLLTDALTRLGDCYFIRKDYDRAIRYYSTASQSGKGRADYALFQQAITQGASGIFADKAGTLKRLVNEYPGSTYADDAKYELGVTYLLLNRNSDALSWFNRVVKDHPKSRFVVKSLLKSGLIYYNDRRNNEALKVLKQVVNEYPGTPESREALNSIRNIYIEQNKVDEYYAFAEGLSFADVSVSEQDSISYIAAENLYMENNCLEAITAFGNYLDRFPFGTFAANASYYKAQCEIKQGNKEQALEALEFVISQPTSGFTENSLLQAARISMELEVWDKALAHYTRLADEAESKEIQLEALEGMADCNYTLGYYADAITSSMKMLASEKVDDHRINKAHYMMAKSYMALDNIENARLEFKIAEKLSNTEQAAESKYMVAYIDYITERLNEAESGVFELSDNYGSHDYWVARGFLLLADIYVAKGNIFQAKETLKSIIENYKGPELGEIAAQKLDELEKSEADTENSKDGIE